MSGLIYDGRAVLAALADAPEGCEWFMDGGAYVIHSRGEIVAEIQPATGEPETTYFPIDVTGALRLADIPEGEGPRPVPVNERPKGAGGARNKRATLPPDAVRFVGYFEYVDTLRDSPHGLESTDVFIALAYAAYADVTTGTGIFPSLAHVESFTGKGRRTIERATGSLMAKGYLFRTGRKEGSGIPVYRLCLPAER